MGRSHGKSADVAVGAVQIEDELNSISLDFSVPTADITSFSDTYQNVLAGKPALTVSGDGSWDPAGGQGDATIFAALGGAAVIYDVEPDGTTGYNGYGVITSYSIKAGVNAAITYSYSQQHNGQAAAADGSAPNRA